MNAYMRLAVNKLRKRQEWTLHDALGLIKLVQPEMMRAGWFLALAGGVLNRGSSTHDLDLVALPMNARRVNLRKLRAVLRTTSATRTHTAARVRKSWRSRGIDDVKHVEVWHLANRRIDLIIPITRSAT